jgi:cytochrome c-type biogenesis protein CcmH/NrfG
MASSSDLSSPDSDKSSPDSDSSSPDQAAGARRRAYVAGMVILVAAGFGIGYVLGNHGPRPDSSGAPAPNDAGALPMPPPGVMTPPVGMGGTGDRTAQVATEPGLAELLPALEKKVAANPRDIDKRVLLARTYLELGKRDKGLDTLRKLHKDAPQNVDAVILLATTLMDSDNKNDLHEAYRTFDEAVRLKPAVSPMTHLYQGEVLVKLGDRNSAIAVWKNYLRTLPANDPRRAPFEERIRATTAG